MLAYNLARFGLLVGCGVLGYVAGLRGIALIAAALLVSGLLSWFLLARQRIAMGEAVGAAVTRGRSRLADRTKAEDAYVDAMLTGDAPRPADSADVGDVTRPDR